jgi:hypothetical protein
MTSSHVHGVGFAHVGVHYEMPFRVVVQTEGEHCQMGGRAMAFEKSKIGSSPSGFGDGADGLSLGHVYRASGLRCAGWAGSERPHGTHPPTDTSDRPEQTKCANVTATVAAAYGRISI